jgi:hypothetical protein
MEVLSIESFLHFGYEYHLYAYEEVANVPRGVKLCDANEVLPASDIFYFQGDFAPGSPACFSDIWRYKLLLERGGWWVDTDMVCVRPFEFSSEHVVGQQRDPERPSLNCAVLRAPAGSPLAKHCFDACQGMDRKTMAWGSTGPKLIHTAIHELGLESCIQPPEVFYDIDFWGLGKLFVPHEVSPCARGVHLWQAMLNDCSLEVDGPFPRNCLYEGFRGLYLRDYCPTEMSEHQSERLAARFARATSSSHMRRRRRTRRLLHALRPWRRAA